MKDTDFRFTPPEVMKPLNKLFGNMFDPCPRDPPSWDGLQIMWTEKNYVNPPYSAISAWVLKAIYEVEKQGCFVAFLIPNDCSTRAFRMLREKAWGRWEIPFRVKFDCPDGKKRDVARSHVCFFLGGLS